MAYYEIWDRDSNNLVAETTTEEEALAIVRQLLDLNPAADPEWLSLSYAENPYQGRRIAMGNALAELARRVGPPAH
jgi:hypothetical protein